MHDCKRTFFSALQPFKIKHYTGYLNPTHTQLQSSKIRYVGGSKPDIFEPFQELQVLNWPASEQ